MRDIDVRSSARARRSERGLIAWIAAVCGTILLTAAIPMTSSAFTAIVTDSRNAAAAKAVFTCADTFAATKRKQQAYFEFAFDEDAGATTARDSSDAQNPGTYQGAGAKDGGSPIACPRDGGGAYALDGSSSRVTTSKSYPPIQTSFSIEAWFKTSGTGRIMGFQSTIDNGSSNYDKHFYIDTGGHLVYGIFNNGTQTLVSPAALNDGAWHYAVGTTSPNGSVLYVDGGKVAENAGFTTAEYFSGYWRIGQGNLASWPDVPSDFSVFPGSIRFAAAYSFVLTADEVASEWSIGRPGPTATPTPTPTATATATPATQAPTEQPATATPATEESATAPITATPATQAPPGTVEQSDDPGPDIITVPQ